MAIPKYSDSDILDICSTLDAAGEAVSVRRIYARAGGSYPRVTRLVAKFKKLKLAHDDRESDPDDLLLALQELTLENDQLRVREAGLHRRIECLEMQLEAERTASRFLRGPSSNDH